MSDDREEVPQDPDAQDAADWASEHPPEPLPDYNATDDAIVGPTPPPRREDMLEPELDEPKYRDAESGEYVTEAYAKANPATTVREED